VDRVRGGAVIDGQNSRSSIGVDIAGTYIRAQGFEVRGTRRYGIEAHRGHDVQVAENIVHTIGALLHGQRGRHCWH
jgi:hypothetical protein